jgi:hypothetical protein
MVLRKTRTKNSEEKAAALRNAQIVACGSCGFRATYLLFTIDLIGCSSRRVQVHIMTSAAK